MGERTGGNLERLSRDLSRSSTHESPEEFIRNTLLAHGFFNHASQRSKDAAMEDEPAKTGGSKEKTGCGISEEDRKRTTQLVSHYREGREFHSLKEPRKLFAQPAKKQHQKNLPLWPAEVECLPHRPRFLSTPPSHREPFYVPDHEVLSPKVRSGEGGGTVVYTNQPGPEKYFVRARAGPSLNMKPTPTCSSNSTSLIFESRFESGNLAKAVQVGRWDYELYLRFDLYTNKHTQWFFFSVCNMKAGQTYRFTIVNLYKASSLYNEGMQPVMYSEVDAKSQHLGWRRAGCNITYFKTPLKRVDTRQEAYYYGLTWSYTFQRANDTCYFAHCYPYTYSDMQEHLHSLLSHPEKALFCKQRTLCHSIAGNPLPILTITSPVVSPHENKVKRAVVVTARVHPGETNGSWMMKGLLDFLTGPSPDAQILRQMFIFKVVPMLNPDGVIVGNYRCSLAGRDLNRNYRTKLREAYPSVWHTKNMVRRLVEEREVVVYCDLHGHSRRQNVFIYGCDMVSDPATRLRARVFPRMLSKNAPTKFSYKGSKFGVQKSKEGTGRVVMWREMGVRNSYTMEATFCGSLLGRERGMQFSTADLGAMGYHFCDTLLDYCDPDQSKVEHILHELEEEYRRSVLAKLAALGQEVPPGVDPLDLVLESDVESSDAGSDSSDSDGPPVHLVGKERKKRRKKLKSRRERNKHKVLLKLTHHKSQGTSQHVQQAAQAQLPPPSDDTMTTAAGGGARRPSLGATPYRYSPVEAARNGGIPIFIQERIEERQKRRSDVESSERLSDDVDYIRAVVTEYLRQGLPHGVVTDTTSQDPRISLTSLTHLPRPPCPMNIAAMPLCEGRSGPGQSRTTSRTSLPRLEDRTVLNATSGHQHTGSRAAFTSQYMAHHLRDVIASSSDVIASTSDVIASTSGMQLPSAGHQSMNSTKNLENLSRLFRQLRPHLLQTVSREAKVSHHHLSRPELRAQVQLDPQRDVRNEVQDPPKAGVHFTGKKVVDGSHSVESADAERVLQPQVKHLGEDHVQVRRRGSDKGHCNTSHTSYGKVISPGSIDQPSAPTNHDRNVVANVHTSYSSLSSSPATSSWESFSKSMKLSEREREYGGQQPARLEYKEPLKVSTDVTLPEDVARPSSRSLLKSLAEERNPQRTTEQLGPIPKSSSAPDPSTSLLRHHHSVVDALPSIPPPTGVPGTDVPVAKAYKRQVAEAVESVQGTSAVKKPLKEPHRGKVRLSLPTTATSVAFQAAHVRPSKSDSSALALPPPSPSSPSSPSPSSAVHCTFPPPEINTYNSQEDTDMFSSRPHTSSSKTERYVPVAANQVFSSKPPSRYGRRPTADDGMLPSTISLMLSGRVKPRPTTMHAQHRPRPLHIRYFTKKTTSFYLD